MTDPAATLATADVLALPGDELATLCLSRPREVIEAVLDRALQ